MLSLELGKGFRVLTIIDSGQQFEWRMSVYAGILDKESVEDYTTTSELCQVESGAVCYE
jgi:hypothetical protein